MRYELRTGKGEMEGASPGDAWRHTVRVKLDRLELCNKALAVAVIILAAMQIAMLVILQT